MKFAETYASLNTEQKQAVDTLDGPLLVIAGPGTGKTQLLSARVANILTATDTLPQSILCLTFTEKAATNMRERLLDMIGTNARNVVVKTFHGLGADIINRYPEYFHQGARLIPAPDVVKLEVIDDLLSALPLSSPLALKFAGEYTLTSEVSKGIAQAKEAGLTPGKLDAITTANLAYIETVTPILQSLLAERVSTKLLERFHELLSQLPEESFQGAIAPIQPLSHVFAGSLEQALSACEVSGKATPLSAWKTEWFETVDGQKMFRDQRRNLWWSELSRVYASYQEEMARRGYFDFSDMILSVIIALEQNETLRADLQEQYNYLLIDEFQDTNDAQFRLAYLIANHPLHEGRPNIMAVGDDDQAIYRFQGASLGNIAAFTASFRDVQIVTLRENYRSHQSILDTASRIAGNIEHRALDLDGNGFEKTLQAVSKESKGVIEHILYPTQVHELAGVTELIKHYYKKENGQIAILARGHESLQQLAALLHHENVPLRYERAANILDVPAVQLVRGILHLLLAVREGRVGQVNEHLSNTLAYDVFGIPPRHLWELAVDNRQSGDWLTYMLNSSDKSLRSIANWIVALAQLAQSQPLAVTIEYVLGLRTFEDRDSPLKSYYDTEELSVSYLQLLSAMSRLRSLALEYSKGREPKLHEFVDFLDLHIDHNVKITDQTVFISGEKPVELLTVHGAKGLEYDTVVVIDCLERIWSPGGRRRVPPKNLESLQDYGEDSDDYARLMYVAATRAKSNLIFASYCRDEAGKDVMSTPLLHEVGQREGTQITETNKANALVSVVTWPELDHTDQKLLFKPLLEEYELSVTHLINFLDLARGGPRCFVERNLLRLPAAKTAALAFGTAMHAALREAQLLTNADNFRLTSVVKAFEVALADEHIREQEHQRYLAHGRQLLTGLFESQKLILPKGSQPERALRSVRVGDARLRGDLDRIDISPSELKIVDYKTGRPLSVDLVSNNAGQEGLRAWKHRLQLIFYTLLVRESELANTQQTVRTEMLYVESTTSREFCRSYTPTENDLVDVRALITTVWGKIQAVDWPDVSGYSPDHKGVQAFVSDLISGDV